MIVNEIPLGYLYPWIQCYALLVLFIGKHFLDKGFILSHGIPKRFTPDHSRPGEVVSPASHEKGATDNVVMVMGELVDVGTETFHLFFIKAFNLFLN